jgi:primary-amine oxidase
MRHSLFSSALILAGSAVAAPDPRRTWDVHSTNHVVGHLSEDSIAHQPSKGASDVCAAPVDVLTKAPKKSPFHPLSASEVGSIVEWLNHPKRGLNLTDASSSKLALSDNYISHIEVLKPNKTDVLAYLDHGVSMPRHARVVLTEGAAEVPKVAEYYVSSVCWDSIPLLSAGLTGSAIGWPTTHLPKD